MKVSKKFLINFVKLSSLDLFFRILEHLFVSKNSHYFAKNDKKCNYVILTSFYSSDIWGYLGKLGSGVIFVTLNYF